MRITKYTHACVRLEHDGGTLVIDPGIWSEPTALAGADAVLITHEHADHVDPPRLEALGVPVYAPAGASIEGLTFTPVAAGERLTPAGFDVRAVGGKHAVIYNGKPGCPNLGYVVAEHIYHPGDSLHVPDQPVETLLVPASGPWLKLDEALDFVKAVKPARAFAIHDALLNDRGVAIFGRWLTQETGTDYRYLTPGQTA